IIALTPVQEGMLYHYLKDPGQDFYFEQLSIAVTGPIDIPSFKKAWNFISENNSALRTVYRWEELNKPAQVVLKRYDVPVEFREFPGSENGNVPGKWLEEVRLKNRMRKFDLRETPFRVTLCKLCEAKFEMIVTHHHILFDGWSTGIILKEFLTVYDALVNGKEPIKVEKGQFKEYVRRLVSPDQPPNGRSEFWRNYLEGVETKTGLPGAKIKGAESGEGSVHICDFKSELPLSLLENLEQFVKIQKLTLADLFYTAWGILLQRYNNCDDVIFGTTVSGRSAKVKGIEDMVGLFINTLPLRITAYDGETVTQLLERVRDSLHERQPYEGDSLVKIKEYSQWDGQGELFDSIVAVDNYPLDNVLKQKDKAISFDSYSMFEMSNYDLTAAVDVFDNVQVKVALSYHTGLFSKEAIVRIFNHWLRLMEDMAAQPGKSVTALDMLTAEEKRRLIYEYNDTAAAYPVELTIHERFEQQAANTPDTLAMVFEDHHYLTYGMLNQRGNRLAYILRNRDVTRECEENVVGVIGEYSLEMAVALLAVLKAGGAYATISPDYPEERVDYILKDSHASILLALARIDFKNRFPGIHFHGDIIEIEDDIIYPAYPGEPLNLPNIAAPHNLSFILYTSGSTGRPKGVMIEHHNVNNLLSWFGRYYRIGPGTRVLQLTDYTFDPHVDDIFGTLFFGSTLYVVGKELLMNMEGLRCYVERHQVNLINCVPSLIKEMLCRGHRLPSMTTVIAGGDRLDDALKDELIDRGYTVYNHYGLIETTVDILISHCSKEVGASVVRPLANTGAYVLDRDQNLAPIGVVGELCLSGDSVGRGYLNKPELTNQKFITKSFAGVQGGLFQKPPLVLYKTGDLARVLPNGHVEILDRIDNQVKIRGFRIELGEIENRLLKYEAVKDAAVKAHDDGSGNKYLCAYIVTESEGFKLSELREYLSAVLPDYMIPARYMFLDKIPLTPIGKIDRKALPKPDGAIEKTYILPRDQVEDTLVGIWAEVLKLEKSSISVTDNFFELGGHSLRATEAVFHTRKTLQVKLELKDFMNKPVIAQQAELVKSLQPIKFMEIQPVETQEYYDLSSAQRRLWIICQFEEDSITYNMAGSFSIKGPIDDRAFEKAIKTLVQRHESFRTVFISVNGQPKQRILNNIDWNLERVDLRSIRDPGLKRQKVKENIRETANRSFKLERGPLFAFKLLRLDEEESLLVANIHHIINDGWSLGIINNEIFTLYNTYKNNLDHALPPLKFQYRDYSLWHNALIQEGRLEPFGRYWLEKFKDKPTGIELPLDHPRGTVQTFNGGRVYFTIEAGQVETLHQVCPEVGATPYMKYLSLINILLYRYTGQQDIIVASPNAGRNNPDLHQMIGFLVNTMVTRNLMEPEVSFRQLLQVVKKETLECYENQDFPFDILVERLGLDRDLSRSPIFNVLLAFDNTEVDDRSLKMEDITFTYNPQMDEFTPSVFDLNFIMDELGGRVNGEIMYNRDLFERSTIERMAKNFQNLVNRIPELPDESCNRLPMMAPEEYETVTHGFNQTDVPFPAVSLQAILEQRTASGLDKIAVVHDDKALTYDQLNRRANRLAHLLRKNYSVTPGTIVGIGMDRSIEMIIAILGVIKSGAGYLAIDPAYPPDRVLHMLADSRAPLTITDKERPLLFENYQGTIIDINVIWRSGLALEESENPDIINTPSDILYVIYTSGSTGTPNGAMLSQGILTNLIQWQNNHTSIDSARRCLQFTSTSFCVSFQEIMITLVSGGEVHLIGDVERQDIDYLMHFLANHRIEILYLPFSYLNFLFTESGRWGESFKHSLKHIITAGEQLKVTSGLKQFLEANPWVKLHNHYGSSEMHVVTSYTLDASSAAKTPIPPAGRPVANTRIYILDEYNNPVPIGVWGELCISGSAEIAGYVYNKELTDRKLLDHPALCKDGKRLYRSGDIGRWLADGNIELIGRKDYQVKVRGFRVELNEVESKILAVSGVRDCVVVVKEAGPGEKMLVAYVVLDGVDAAKIKRVIRNYLPHYMVPKFAALDALPLMSNGKVDRDRLPALTPGAMTGEDMLPEILPDRINELLADRSPVKPGTPGITAHTELEMTIARLTRFLVGHVLPGGARVSGIDIDIFRGDERRLDQMAPHFFEEQANRTPDAISVVGTDFSISYHELNRRANRLASLLRKNGVSQGATVGLMLTPSPEMIEGILGILKAGGNYLPILPGQSTSTDSIISLLEDHGVKLFLTSGKDLGKHPFALLQGVDTIVQPPLVTTPRPQITDFDGLPFPDRSLVSYEKYSRYVGLGMVKNTITLQATRGCPYNCLYCHKIWPKKHVFRGAENIFQEVEHYYRLGVRRFTFADDIFNLDNSNSRRFFQLVVKNRLDINLFFPNGLRSDLLTRDYIDLMVEAGTAGVAMALETASPRLQKLIRKHLNLDKLRENIDYFCRRYPQVILELFTMHGFPTETEEEALLTFDFVKNLHWIDFPYLLILKIYPNTDMAALALETGIPLEAITRSAHMAYHELPETLPFDKGFTLKYQSDFANEYFLLKERLLAKMPYQIKVMTPDEMVEKYNSYLPVGIKSFAGMLDFLGLRPDELGLRLDESGNPLSETYPLVRQGIKPQDLDAGIRRLFSRQIATAPMEPAPDALRILLLDLSQFFSHEREIVYDGVEPPLGLMALLTYLKRELGNRVKGRIAKARVDFDNYSELKALLENFKPHVIGIRTLSHHRDFFHKTVTMMRQWGIDVPIIAGGPYATSDCAAILQDRHVDLVVLSEGELTFTELIKEMIKNNGQLPALGVLEKIQGIAFIPPSRRGETSTCREILLMDGLDDALAKEIDTNPVETLLIMPHDHDGDLKRRKPVVSWVFDGAPHQVFSVLSQGGSLCVAPEVAGNIGEVSLLEFYQAKDSSGGEAGFHIHLELPENSPLIKKQRFENDVEEKLADIWSELLGVDKNMIGREDSFFELGGHSLKAATMMTRIHKTFNTSIKLIEIFKAPTLRGIGELIRAAGLDPFTAISPVEKREYYPLSAAQKRMYILQQMELASIAYNMPQVFVWHNPNPGLVEKLSHAFKKLVERHETLRTSFHIINGVPVQRIHECVEIENLTKVFGSPGTFFQKGSWPPEAIIKTFIQPFDLSHAPLLRVGLVEVSPHKCFIMTDMHHIISDGVSVQVLVRDFGALFAGIELEPLRLQYKDFSQWQNNEKEQAAIKQQGIYWREQLDGEIPLLNLPIDFPRPAVQSFAGNETRFEISPDVTAALINLALENGTTLYMVLLSIYNVLLAKLSGQEDIIVGTAVAGRKHADLEQIIGMFVNTLPLRNFPDGDRTFTDFLAEVKQRTLDAFANQDYPYEALVEELAPERDAGRNPLFDVVFALQNTARLELNIPGLELEAYEDENIMPISKFDLTLQAIETGN
ncbi:MAG: hypothetical protein QG657_876, partial [Acidobacteriota bacterium]|nr:hypothetical protein [Acidobacteriota bacterium]